MQKEWTARQFWDKRGIYFKIAFYRKKRKKKNIYKMLWKNDGRWSGVSIIVLSLLFLSVHTTMVLSGLCILGGLLGNLGLGEVVLLGKLQVLQELGIAAWKCYRIRFFFQKKHHFSGVNYFNKRGGGEEKKQQNPRNHDVTSNSAIKRKIILDVLYNTRRT
jgi:hypothetical protein